MLSCQKYNLVTSKLNLQKLRARLDVKMPVEGGQRASLALLFSCTGSADAVPSSSLRDHLGETSALTQPCGAAVAGSHSLDKTLEEQ